MAMGGKDEFAIVDPQNAGKFEPWECAFERDHVPPLDPEADKLFQEARGLQKKRVTAGNFQPERGQSK